MRLGQSRRLAVSLGLGMALSLGTVFPLVAATVSTLTSETLTGSSASGNSGACPSPSYSVSGTATGPYPGTFTERGSWSVSSGVFNATFTITSGTTTVTGTKIGGSPGFLGCDGFAGAQLESVPYTATIHTPTGNYHDEGTSQVTVVFTGTAATLTETFTSSLTQATLIVPTSKDQCKDHGWQNYPQFKN